MNHAFIGVSVPRGLHDVSIAYDVSPHVFAQRVAVVAWILVLLGACLPLLRRKTRV